MRLTAERSEELVDAASGGDRQAWEELVESYGGLVWAITRNHRLSAGDAADVSQTTWLRLVENIDRIHDRSRIGAWLATTARRECLRVIGQTRRVVVLPSEDLDGALPQQAGVDSAVLADERDQEVRRAMQQLPPNCQLLLHLLMLDPPPSYEQVSEALGIPIGSIGPTRGRCLAKLHEILEPSRTAEVGGRSLGV